MLRLVLWPTTDFGSLDPGVGFRAGKLPSLRLQFRVKGLGFGTKGLGFREIVEGPGFRDPK